MITGGTMFHALRVHIMLSRRLPSHIVWPMLGEGHSTHEYFETAAGSCQNTQFLLRVRALYTLPQRKPHKVAQLRTYIEKKLYKVM